ncbi:HU family DNA-binding protein [Blautia sp. MSJ-9]|uniref:HU family DNA-binding protein n=1 Tax=Blautia sp. MSJ-9 TaxID=2841511 RepID=UPI000E47D100|nr:HU family DNA-binding protein [Blautia sp. MSJ-9]MBU5680541.1 HU family DNA-binding protein [Blautia sp. MSJ-9]RHG54183.1 HU family DNA-binding protein [Ruminococcus sp. AM22-13]
MKRQQMIRRYSEIQNCTYEQAEFAIDTVATLICEGLTEDGKASLKYVGKFEIRNYKEHKGFDFRNGRSLEIPAHNRIKFTPSEKLREEILYKEIVNK